MVGEGRPSTTLAAADQKSRGWWAFARHDDVGRPLRPASTRPPAPCVRMPPHARFGPGPPLCLCWRVRHKGGNQHALRPDHPRPVPAGRRHAAAPAGRPARRQARRGTRLRPGGQRLALQFASVPVHPADPLSLPGRHGGAEAAAAARRGAAAAAQPAARRRGARLARRDVQRQAGLRCRHRLPRSGVPRLRHHAEAGRQALRGMPDRGEAPVVGRLRHHAGVVFRAGGRQLHHAAGAEADAAGLDRRQRQCRHPARRAHGRCVVHQSAQQAGHHRRADGGLQARAGRRRQAVPGRTADGARGVRAPARATRRSGWRGRRWRRNTRRIATGARTR